MVYIKIRPDYSSRQFSARLKQLIDNCSLDPPLWEKVEDAEAWKLPYGCELTLPIKMAELLPGEWIFLRAYTSEELAPVHEDKILFNEKTKAAVPNQALWSITNVRVENDMCTDMLQDLLEEGWHILAICPQPQRRPDYVLGKGPKLQKQTPEIPEETPF